MQGLVGNVDDHDRSIARVEPAIVLPIQYIACRAASLQPEMRLMLAVLEEAVGTYLKCRDVSAFRRRRAFRDVDDWLRSDNANWPFAFVRVCQWLGLDAAYVRAGLIRNVSARPIEPRFLPPARHRVADTRHRINALRERRRAGKPMPRSGRWTA